MPGPPAPFTDTTIMLLYGPPNQGKTTFAHFLSDPIRPILSLDSIFISVCKENTEALQPFLIPSKPIDHQLGRLLQKLSKDDSNPLLDRITHDIFFHISKQLSEYANTYRFIIVEGHILYAVPSLRESLISYITHNKWRYWNCHK